MRLNHNASIFDSHSPAPHGHTGRGAPSVRYLHGAGALLLQMPQQQHVNEMQDNEHGGDLVACLGGMNEVMEYDMHGHEMLEVLIILHIPAKVRRCSSSRSGHVLKCVECFELCDTLDISRKQGRVKVFELLKCSKYARRRMFELL